MLNISCQNKQIIKAYNFKSLFIILFVIGIICDYTQVMAANPSASGALRIEALNAPNFVVDSNIETPATYGPKAVHLGAHFCNDGSNNLTDVIVNIGDFANGTPGVYPVETVDEVANGWSYSGNFSLTHGTSSLADATRYIGTIPAGECRTQYWMITYPQLDAMGKAVFGANTDFSDDLVLNYDFWATATESGASQAADQRYSATMRRELSAAANKIWPNTTSKVPTEYLDAIQETLGWRPTAGSEVTEAGGVSTVSGVWYDFGVVNQGFDNDGNLVPDYNAWAQPVGDPAVFDSACFKLTKTYGILIVKHNTGVDELVPFVDELYFSNIAPDNTGLVGLVYYEFQGLDGTCSIQLSPYQEVASGRDNEKFNGDYGTFVGGFTSTQPSVTFTKGSDVPTIAEGGTITYTMSATNLQNSGNNAISIGDPNIGSPLVFNDTIPAGTKYVFDSASTGNTLPAGVLVNVLYSSDNGTTWTAIKPTNQAEADLITNLQWWLDAPLDVGDTATVTFMTTVSPTYIVDQSSIAVDNEACLSFGSSSSFLCDDVTVFLEGTLSISGTVFEDDGTGVGGVTADGILNGTEPGHALTTVTLYLDLNGDGIVDATDPVWATTVSAVDGTYSFANLPAGDFIVQLDTADPDLFTGSTTGWGLTSGENQSVTLVATNVTGVDFGIAPALAITKTLNGTSPVGEGDVISYNIIVQNLLADTSGGVGTASCTYDFYATNVLASKTQITNPGFAVVNTAGSSDEPDGTFAVTSGGGDGYLSVNQFDILAQPEAIQKVELVFLVQSVAATWVDDVMDFQLRDSADTVLVAGQLSTAQLNALSTTTNVEAILDVTSAFTWDYNTSVTENLHAYIEENKTASSDSDIRIDAIALRYTTDCGGGGGTYDINKTLSPLPLNDTFDATYLQFVSAVPSPDASDNVAGTLSWNDVGPLNAGASRTIQVKFKTQLPGAAGQTNVLNTAFSNTTKFANGLSANTATDDELVDIDPRVELSGTVWNDSTGSVNGWSGAVGHEGADTFVSGVTVNLYACLDASGIVYTANTGPNPASNSAKACVSVQNNGTWTVVDTTTTDVNGDYLFTGIEEGYYYVEVDSATLPGTVTQSGDPDETGAVCSTCDNIWQNTTANLNNLTYVPAVPGDITEINFGYNVNPAVYGNVWEDKNGDGSQGIGELALVGWTVELQDASCTPGSTCPTTLTDANGDYSFGDLLTATAYTLTITSPFPGDTTWTETFESDGSINNGITNTLSAGQISGSHDFAFQHTGSSTIGDLVFADWNGNGIYDAASEQGIPGVTVRLYEDVNGDGVLDLAVDPIITSTSSTGTYNFTNLPAGSFFVVVDETTLPTGYGQTSDPNETGICSICDARDFVTVDGTNTPITGIVDTADFGYLPSGLYDIGDFVFTDVNGNGAIEAGDTGIANITVTLQVDLDGSGYVTIKTTTTDASGLYRFSNLPDANYRVIVDAADTDLPNDVYGNNGIFTTATQFDITLSGADNLTADFGYNVYASIGDTIFQDDNGNAIQDSNEPGIAGVIVELFDPNGVSLGTDTTDANGNYLFTQIQPQFDVNGDPLEYKVVIDSTGVLANFTATGDPDRDGIACADTSFDGSPTPPPACDDQTVEALSYGTNFMGADFGYQPPGAFGDQVWVDINSDGIKDVGEPGLSGVTITVTGTGGPYTTITDTDGLYSFGNLADGIYTVTIDATNFNVGNALENYGAVYDPDATLDNVTTVTIAGGVVTHVGGSACSNCELTVDFGYKLAGAFSLAGSICYEDVAIDGTCDALGGDDSGVSTQTVYLYDVGGNLLASATTDANGDYSFTGLPADTYQVVVGTTLAPLSFGSLTTTTGNTSFSGTSNSITDSGSSVIQNVTIATNSVDLDFAFDLTAAIDFGDLPSPFATTLAAGGAYHVLDPVNTLYLGPMVADSESDGLATVNADGDGADDADGLGYGIISNWTTGANGGVIQLQVGGTGTTAGGGYVVGWIDFNGDGDFTDSGEMVVDSAVSNGYGYFNITIPAGASLDSQIYSRFRVFEVAPPISALAYVGAYSKGEVEDYLLDFRVPGSIGDSVWLDEDGDGIEDIFEPGIANVLVELQDGTCTPTVDCPTTTTDANGQYLFTGVYAGNYTVDIVSGIPAGLTTAPGTTDPNGAFALANGENKLDVDFGYVPTTGTAIIGDQVFVDDNSDGVQNPGELGIAGVTLDLIDSTGAVVDTVTTLTDGSYLFVNVTPGDYTVSVTDTGNVLTGYTVTTSTHTPIDSITDPITLLVDTIYTDADFGYVNSNLVSYTDRVWLDADNGSDFDVGTEKGIAGVTINLLDGSNNVIATTVSGSDGTFSFYGLAQNSTYTVAVADGDNVLGTLDPTTTGATNGQVTLNTTTVDSDISTSAPSFGYYEPGGVSGLIWSDADGDGLRDLGEAAISGITVELQGNGCVSGSTCPTTTTAIDGTYLFDGYLPAGYTVVVNPVAGVGTVVPTYTQTGDPDATLDNQTSVTITAGSIDENNDFGYRNTALADISGTVFYDTDADGVYEIKGNDGVAANTDDEYGISSVTVELQDDSGNIIATTTAASDGTYSFPDLPAGNYTVVITDTNQIVSGYEATSGLDYRSVTLAAVDITDVDFGYVDEPQTGSIGDLVWLDSDGDGIKDPSEPGLSAVGLELYEDTNNNGVLDMGTGDTLLASTTTDTNGQYVFSALTSGNYFVDVTEADIPANLTATTFVVGNSDLIPLSEGESVEYVDFGFKPNTGTGALSGLVWSDADSNGIANAGEVGIGDGTVIVTITVYDANTNMAVATTESNPDGSWIVTGLAAGNYTVSYDSTDIPSGYLTPTQPTNFSAGNDTYSLTLSAGQTINNLDFGFDPGAATGALSGTVYNDLDGDSMQENPGANGVELGIWDITLNLIDSNNNVVATTRTDVNGDYAFTGIAPGNYTVVITDIKGTLNGLNPTQIFTNPYAIVAATTTTNVDAGYVSGNALGSIGNLVFLDTVNEGTYDIGIERGIAGVSLQCWSDTNANGTIEPGTDNLIRTVVTDANGEYYCNSVPSGLYVVRVTDREGIVTGYTSTNIANPTGLDNMSNDPTGYALQTNSPNYTADFGYKGSFLISGTVFEDENNDTINDALENKVQNATVTLYDDLNGDGILDPGEPQIGTTTTAASGSYQFTAIPVGDYLLVPDVSGTTVNGFTQTTQLASNGIIAVSVGPNSINNDFGFYNNGVTTTPVTLASFKATRSANATVFQWSTETETGNIGFRMITENSSGQIVELTDLIESEVVDSLEPQYYSTAISRTDFEKVWIIDMDIYGTESKHGPFIIDKQYGSEELNTETINWNRIQSESRQLSTNRLNLMDVGEISAMDFKVAEDGVYRVTFEQILDAGLNLTDVNLNKLRFESNGQDVAVYINTNGAPNFGPGSWLEFIGHKLDNYLYSRTNVYRLSVAKDSSGRLLRIKDNDTGFEGINATAYYLAHEIKDEDINYSFSARGSDPWYRDRIFARNGDAVKEYDLNLDYLQNTTASLSYEIWGGTDFPNVIDHHIQISVNDVVLVDQMFDGVNIVNGNVDIPDNLLIEGHNDVQVNAILEEGVRYSLVNVNWIGIHYNSKLVTDTDYIKFTALSDVGLNSSKDTNNEQIIFNSGFEDSNQNGLLVDGLSEAEGIVYALTSDNAMRLNSLTYNDTDNGYAVSFNDISPSHQYVVTTVSHLMTPELVPVNENVDLLKGTFDYLMIAHPDFIEGLSSLKAFHETNGLTVKIVNVNDVYSQYSHGIVNPDAISNYIEDAIENNDIKYVLLVGGDSYDYMDNLGLGSFSFIPSYYVKTDNLITYTPSDVPYVDFDGDNVPDIALGRFPIRTISSLEAMINKTIQYASNTYTKTSVFSADKYVNGSNFGLYSDGLIQQLNENWSVSRVYLDEDNQAVATQSLIDEINLGTSLVSYFGHSGPSTWSFDRLLGLNNIQGLTNFDKSTVVVQWGCWNAYHVTANAETMAHKFLVNSNGAAAVLGASTLTTLNSDKAIGKLFIEKASKPNKSIGQALLEAKQKLSEDHPEYLDVLLGYTILGDPAIIMSQ